MGAVVESSARYSSRYKHTCPDGENFNLRSWSAPETGRPGRTRSGLNAIRGVHRDGVLHFRILQHGGKRRIGLYRLHVLVTLVAGLAQINYAALEVSGFGKSFSEQKIKLAALS